MISGHLAAFAPQRSAGMVRGADGPFVMGGIGRDISPYLRVGAACAPFAAAMPSMMIRHSAAQDLAQILADRRYRPRVLSIGGTCEPYPPTEERLGLMSQVLNVLEAYGQPVRITTASALILRDLDLLVMLALRGLVRVTVPIPSLDHAIAGDQPARRLAVMRALSGAGIPVRVIAGPIIAGLTDPELLLILATARGAGATSAGFSTLRGGARADLQRWLGRHAPQRAATVMARLTAMDGAQRGGIWAELMAGQFRHAAQRTGFTAPPAPLRCDLFRLPVRPFC